MSTRSLLLPVLLLSLLSYGLHADVVCAKIFGNAMVLQREKPLRVWGTADAGEKVSVSFAGQTVTCEASAEGKWMLELAPLKTNAEPGTMTVAGKNTISFTDVLVGEVWFCSGQSNMEKPLGERRGQTPTDNYQEELKKATLPGVRLYQVPRNGKVLDGQPSFIWLPCNADNLNKLPFSAAAYFFGAQLNRELGVPIGLIHSSFGGTRIEPWTPLEGFEPFEELKGFAEASRNQQKFDGVTVSGLYRSMVEPLVPVTIRGCIWYQGESNCMNTDGLGYTVKMRALIEGWRKVFKDDSLPFYYVHLAPWIYSEWKTGPKKLPILTTEALPLTWDAQIAALKIPHTGLVPTIDITSDLKDIHPTNKKDVGQRLARLALSDTYKRRVQAWCGPVFKSVKAKKGSLVVDLAGAKGLKTRDGKAPSHFMIAGEDRRFVPAEAKIKGKTLVVSSPEVTKPVAVRFAWHETALPNLINGDGLPVLPFRTDDWPVDAVRKAQ